MKRPKALDLFCGAGGVSKGLHDAGFDVVGVDISPMPEYPRGPGFEFVQANALTYQLDGFDLIWASPKCQRWSQATRQTGKPKDYPDQIAPIRERLHTSGTPFIIENVLGAPLLDPITLCGAMFGLGVVRHRLFECSFPIERPSHPAHAGSLVTGEYVTVVGEQGVSNWVRGERKRRGLPIKVEGEQTLTRWRSSMGIDWMSRKTLVQAIPPKYAEWIGVRALAYLRAVGRVTP